MEYRGKRILLIVCIFFAYFACISCEECGRGDGTIFSCPTSSDLSHYTQCCLRNQSVIECCPSNQFDDSLVMMISIFVILLCLILAIFFVICCFWSPCPLYSVCRINYTYGDIVAYTKEEEALNLPPETCRKNNYTPLHVTVKAVEEA